jgi:hypothetical protein
MTDLPIDCVRAEGIARENAMRWAMSTAMTGEDPMAILARAQLYEEYVLAPVRTPGGTGRLVLNVEQSHVDKG